MKQDFVVKSIRWDITDKCNLSCIHCYTLKQACPDLDLRTVTHIIEKVMPHGLQEINFSGREPTLHETFCDIVTWCSEKGLRINITTNGSITTAKEYKRLLASSVNMLVFSLDGATAVVHDGIRGRGSFKKVIDNIKCCVEFIKNHGTDQKIGVSYTLQKKNWQDIDGFIDMCAMLDIDLLAINPVSLCGAAAKTKRSLYLSPGTILDCWEKICQRYAGSSYRFDMYLGTFPMEAKWLNARFRLDLPVIFSGCSAGRTLYIDPRGRALPCYMLPAVATVIPKMEPYIEYWDVMNESCSAAVARFRPFIEFTERCSQDNEPGCRDCPDLRVCKRCALIALSDHDAISRCQLARKKLDAMALAVTPQSIPRIKSHVSWKVNDNELWLNVSRGNYFAKRAFALDDAALRIWNCITGVHSLREIEEYLQNQDPGCPREQISTGLMDFVEYFWKDGVIEIHG